MKLLLLLPTLFILSFQTAIAQLFEDEALKSNIHPSILLKKGEEQALKEAIQASPQLTIVENAIIEQADKLLEKPTLTYQKTGKRLLDVSRECLKRVFYWSYCFRMLGEKKYVLRTEQELLAVSNFPDWNPSHFLDVAEMTMALSIGYDWLFDEMSEASRQTISTAIIQKGLIASKNEKDAWFLKSDNNWNQVCNAGMLFGALAIREKETDLAKFIVERSLQSVNLPMQQYEPNGNFNEGYMYWGYGTSFNVMMMDAAEKFFAKELFPNNKMQGFMKSADYMLHMVGTSSKPFNYGDCNNNVLLNPPVFWFAKRSVNVSLLYNELKLIKADNKRLTNERLLPAVLLWGAGLEMEKAQAPQTNFFIGKGEAPVCLMRTSWTNPNAIFVGVKAGSPSSNHGHMDVGSFVLDALGERWASDFGMQDYNSLESKGLKIFDKKQSSDRWKVFRYTNLTHNTLAFNDSLQRINGKAVFENYTNQQNILSCTSNLTSVYDGQVKSAKRTVSLKDDKMVVIEDEIIANNQSTKLRWSMLTEASPTLNEKNGEILLTIKEKQLRLKVNANTKFTLKTWTTQSTNTYDAPNPGTIIIGFEADLTPKQAATFKVSLVPIEK